MIKLFVVIGIAVVSLATYLATFGQGPDFQKSQSTSLYVKFQKEGLMPDANAVVENEEVEHGVFEVPEEDERQLKMAMSNMEGMDMGGMKMDGEGTMKMDGEGTMKMPMADEAKTTMKMEGDGSMKMPMADEAKTSMKMEGDGSMKMPMADEAKTAMKMEGDGSMKMPMADEAKTTMKMEGDGSMKMPMADEAKTAMKMDEEKKVEGGLKITKEGKFDREVTLTMAEWKFSSLNLKVKKGEKIRFTIANEGKIPHEFMFMSMAAMQAVNYRAKRADWNLLEHEALFEKSLVLPGGKFTFVAEIQQDGAWMFMCMLPYHMQMGMMGQIATPGMAMDMDNMQM